MLSVILLSSNFQVYFYSKESTVDCNFFFLFLPNVLRSDLGEDMTGPYVFVFCCLIFLMTTVHTVQQRMFLLTLKCQNISLGNASAIQQIN
jgi:hypothetical protein